MGPHFLALLALLGLAALLPASAAAPSGVACSAEDGTCPGVPTAVAKEHLLLQTRVQQMPGNAGDGKAAKPMTGLAGVQPQGEGEEQEEEDKEDEEEEEEEEEELVADEQDMSAQMDACWNVGRRRRYLDLHDCRRRHQSPGHLDTDHGTALCVCDEQRDRMVPKATAPAPAPPLPIDDRQDKDHVLGYPRTNEIKALGLWCQVPIPPRGWALKSCPYSGGTSTTVKVLSYNLYWWRLFGQLGGNARSSGHLIARTSGPEEYDLMAFQECDDRWRIVNDAKMEGLSGEYDTIDGGKALAIAYRKSRWALLGQGKLDVGEDDKAQYYGRRSAQWARLQHTDGKTLFFMNHHGPLPVSSGGGCAGSATSLNILQAIANNAHARDVIILVGDFNAQPSSTRIQELDKHLTRVFSGVQMGGVDHIFTNCGVGAAGSNLGQGGSDHDAISAKFVL